MTGLNCRVKTVHLKPISVLGMSKKEREQAVKTQRIAYEAAMLSVNAYYKHRQNTMPVVVKTAEEIQDDEVTTEYKGADHD
jgi:hypothetical protein